MGRFRWLWLVAFGLAAGAPALHADRISDLEAVRAGEQFVRFFSMEDPALRTVLLGSLCLGLCCGLLGSFIVVRKLSLVGDALSHAVLPGVAIGFIFAGEKDPLAIFVGATVAGVLGAVMVNLIKQTTHIKEDSSLGMILAGFYGVGSVLINMISKQPVGNKAGIDKFLFGQAAALSEGELVIMAIIAAASLLAITLFYKQFLVGSFDPGFSRSLGIPTSVFHYALMLMLAFAVVISLQAVGAVLVSAMLIIPAASAYLLTDRMHRMLMLASVFGMLSGSLGAFFSYLGNNLSTGPLMVIASSSIFAAAFFFSPRHGIVSKWRRRRSRSRRIRDENTLKAIYQVREQPGYNEEGVSLEALADRLNEPVPEARRRAAELAKQRLGDLRPVNGSHAVYLNPEGWLKACAIVRNHRLWELYLTNQAAYEPDHVHEDAEKIEHMLGEETVRKLERLLDYPAEDPHGKLIPSLTDLQKSLTRGAPLSEETTGYRMPKA